MPPTDSVRPSIYSSSSIQPSGGRANFNDPLWLRHPPDGFYCGEILQEDGCVGAVLFHCVQPDGTRRSFSCRGRSLGVLHPHESTLNDEEDMTLATVNESVDPYFFDQNYNLAAKTGFQIWAGTRLLVESLLWPCQNDHPRLSYWQQRIQDGIAVVELGAGVGVTGTMLATAGAHVLLTDLPTLVEHATLPNLYLNSFACDESDVSTPPPRQDRLIIGRGTAHAAVLDWKQPLLQQLTRKQLANVELIVASDCVWLVSMLEALLNTVASIFKVCSQCHSLILSFQRRDMAKSGKDADEKPMFASVEDVLRSVEDRGWKLTCLAWRPLDDDPSKEVYVFEATLDQTQMHT